MGGEAGGKAFRMSDLKGEATEVRGSAESVNVVRRSGWRVRQLDGGNSGSGDLSDSER